MIIIKLYLNVFYSILSKTEKGEVINCGRNDYGQLGSLDNEFLKPWNLHTLENIHKISIGSEHAVGLTGIFKH